METLEITRNLYEPQEKAIQVFVSNMTELANNREKTVPEGYYDALIKVVDLLQKLDNLKVYGPALRLQRAHCLSPAPRLSLPLVPCRSSSEATCSRRSNGKVAISLRRRTCVPPPRSAGSAKVSSRSRPSIVCAGPPYGDRRRESARNRAASVPLHQAPSSG